MAGGHAVNSGGEARSLRSAEKDPPSLPDHRGEVESDQQRREAQKMEALGRMAAGMAHDFNNLLMVIEAECAVIEAHVSPGSPARAEVGEIRRACMRGAAMTSQLLAFSKSQSFSPSRVEINQIILRLVGLLEGVVGEGIQLETDLEEEAWPILADPAQIEQVVVNLAINAREAMGAEGRLSIETTNEALSASAPTVCSACHRGDWVVLRVTDTGAGIEPELRERIFEPYFTTKRAGRGTGLGLSTVYGIVQQNGGFIELTSDPGRGSTFAVYLPRETGDPLVS